MMGRLSLEWLTQPLIQCPTSLEKSAPWSLRVSEKISCGTRPRGYIPHTLRRCCSFGMSFSAFAPSTTLQASAPSARTALI
jgi:hypothetical protein